MLFGRVAVLLSVFSSPPVRGWLHILGEDEQAR